MISCPGLVNTLIFCPVVKPNASRQRLSGCRLDGAVIGSTASADKNRLETGTLGFSDMENHADYRAEHQSAGISSGGSIAGEFAGNMANGLLTGVNHSGSGSSLTKAAVSDGALDEPGIGLNWSDAWTRHSN